MSELKWNWVYYPYLDAPYKQEESALKAGYIKVVIKDEADKVIADLDESHKMEVEQLLMEIVGLKDKALQYKVLDKEHCRDLNTQERRFALQIAHHKFKRCLAMAERWLFAFYATNKCNDKFYLRSLKYRELAEKFKEAK